MTFLFVASQLWREYGETGMIARLTNVFAGFLSTVRRLPATNLSVGARLRLVL